MHTNTQNERPTLSFWQIWNMCLGFMGIQFGFALQNANVSRIFQTLGAKIDDIPILWVAAPLTGLIVQPIIGYMSDKTWGRLGRRRPYFFYGAIVTTAALLVMPNSPTLWVAAGMLWIMDASINVTMEPFRALVGDNLPNKQRALGYSLQSFFIGVGAVIASSLPWVLTNWFDVSNTAAQGFIPTSVQYAFYVGGAFLLICVMWTVFTTKEYSPKQLAAFTDDTEERAQGTAKSSINFAKSLVVSGSLGVLIMLAVSLLGLEKELYLLGGLLVVFAMLQGLAAWQQRQGYIANGFFTVVHDVFTMPTAMRQLAWVQFFSWFSLFAMWIYTTAAVTSYHYHSVDVTSKAYNDGADWVGVLFAAYNGFAALAALIIPMMVKRLGIRAAHGFNLCLGALSLMSFLIISEPAWLMLPMVGIGFAWASILSLPYAMLANALPSAKMGVYMGIFNFFIVIPQLLAASVLGLILKHGFANQPIFALVIGGVSFVLAAVSVMRVKINN